METKKELRSARNVKNAISSSVNTPESENYTRLLNAVNKSSEIEHGAALLVGMPDSSHLGIKTIPPPMPTTDPIIPATKASFAKSIISLAEAAVLFTCYSNWVVLSNSLPFPFTSCNSKSRSGELRPFFCPFVEESCAIKSLTA